MMNDKFLKHWDSMIIFYKGFLIKVGVTLGNLISLGVEPKEIKKGFSRVSQK